MQKMVDIKPNVNYTVFVVAVVLMTYMNIKQITITRKFNLGNYETQDVQLTLEIPEELNASEISLEAFRLFHEIIHTSDLPNDVRGAYYYKQVKPFRDKYPLNLEKEDTNAE